MNMKKIAGTAFIFFDKEYYGNNSYAIHTKYGQFN